MAKEPMRDRADEGPLVSNVQNFHGAPGSVFNVVQNGPLSVSSGAFRSFTYADLKALSDSTAADCDLVAVRDDRTSLRLGGGAYVRRTVEERLLELLARTVTVALVGEAGYGKSSVLWHLHHRLTRLGQAPLLLPASVLLDDSSAELTVEMVGAALRGRPADQRSVLLVDTLDLLLHDAESRLRVNELLGLARRERLPALVTSRPAEARFVATTEDPDQESVRRGERLVKVPLDAYDERERREAIAAYSRLFYSPERADEVAGVLERAFLRGLPLQEVCRNPLAMRLLFELYAPGQVPPEDIDSISLHDQFWLRRVVDDDRGHHIAVTAEDLSAEAEGVALTLLSAGSIESPKARLVARAGPLAGTDEKSMDRAVDALRARGVLRSPPQGHRFRFFHQTFFEHAAARSVLASGEAAARLLLKQVESDPHDLFYGEVAAQSLLLADHRFRFPGLSTEVLTRWLAGNDRGLCVLAVRTYARMPEPSDELRETAVHALTDCTADIAMDYLALLPSVHHRSFDRAEAELSVLWRRATTLQDDKSTRKEGASMALAVLDACARLAASHPDAVDAFLQDGDRLDRFEGMPLTLLRSRNNMYLRLLEALYLHAPRTWGPVLARFIGRFARTKEVGGAAEILKLINRRPEVVLDDGSAEAVVEAVHGFASADNALRLEREYVTFRLPWYSGRGAEELAATTTAAFTAPGLSTVGRRAELRTLVRAALELDAAGAENFLTSVLAVDGYAAQEGAATVLGESLAADGTPPRHLTSRARARCKAELARLPAQRDAEGNRPLPMLFVNALYGARPGPDALLDALPEPVPDSWWSDMGALMPLLVPAALAGHPPAARALRAVLTDPRADRRGIDSALGRLRAAIEEGSAEALEYFVLRVEITGDSTPLSAILQRPALTPWHLRRHRTRLCDLRGQMVVSGDRNRLAKGYELWRALIDHGLDDPPRTGDLARTIRELPGYPLLVATLNLAATCLRNGAWTGQDIGELADALVPHTVRQGTGTQESATARAYAHWLLIGLRARHGHVPSTPVGRRAYATELLNLIKDAGYDLSLPLEQDALSQCLTELGRLFDRIADPSVLSDLILDGARWLHETQPDATRWRRRVAQAWHPAIITTISGAPPGECRRLVTGLLETDGEMASLAVAACVDWIRPIPLWLQNLGPEMPPSVYKRMLGAMNRAAREGSVRSFPALYTTALTARTRA